MATHSSLASAADFELHQFSIFYENSRLLLLVLMENYALALIKECIIIGCIKILQPTIRDEEAFCSQYLKRSRKLARLLSTTRSHDYSTLYYVTLAKNILAGKRPRTYIFPSVDFYAFQVYYFDRYMVDDNFKVLFDLVYLYIFAFYRSWASCNSATFPEDISAEVYTLVYFSSKVILLMIKSHDKYQSHILVGLAHAEKANSGNRSIFVHN